MPHTWDPTSLSPSDALSLLLAGNRRFCATRGASRLGSWSPHQASAAQRPYAIILGCSDSRTPVEILFDADFGDLFVVRVAGNVVAPSVVGSIEFAASQFGSRLVVVMGHTSCGAIMATIAAIQTGLSHVSKNIRSITDRIAPHIEHVVRLDEPSTMVQTATRAHVLASANQLRHGSQILEELVLAGRMSVVGAEYDLETGEVQFLEDA